MMRPGLKALALRKCALCGDPIGSKRCVNSPGGTTEHEWCFGLRMKRERDAALVHIAMLHEALQSVQHNRLCACYMLAGPCDRCRIGYEEVDAALAATAPKVQP